MRSRPVLLIDGAARGDIGVVRSLGLAGIPVHVLASKPRSPTTASRYVASVHAFPPKAASDAEKVERVREVASALPERPVMLATGDSALRFQSENRAALEDVLDHDLAPASVIETCVDKDRFSEAATKLGLPTPETYAPTTADQAREAAERLRFPVFVKPVKREDWARLPEGTVTGIKGQRVETRDEWLRLYDDLERHNAHRLVIQSLVVGDDSEHMSVHAYVDPEGRVVGAFTGKKLRIWPPHAGVGALVVSRRMEEPLQLAIRSLQALNYTGFAILQFKRDVRTGAYELLEINCRYSTWTELPSRAGCNFPAAAYAVITGQPIPRLEQREGIAWLDFGRDLETMSVYRRAGEWSWWGYLRSLSPVRCWAFFAWDDPGPYFRKLRR